MTRLILVLSALGGWYLTGALKATAIIVASGIGVMFVIREWQSGIANINQMTGSEFKEYVGSLLRVKDTV